jgi:hypothetical protein
MFYYTLVKGYGLQLRRNDAHGFIRQKGSLDELRIHDFSCD